MLVESQGYSLENTDTKDWYAPYFQTAWGKGLFSSSADFKAAAPMNRGTISEMIYRAMRPASESKSCPLFNTPFIDLEAVESITPLGNLNPPDHTLPTEHMYIHLKEGRRGTPLYAPGDVTILSIRGEQDYSIFFQKCGGLKGYFFHVKTLSPALVPLLNKEGCRGANTPDRCLLPVKAGDLLGTVGLASHMNFDFGAYDENRQLSFANPKRYRSRTPHILCPLDGYEADLKQALYSKVNRTDGVCGNVMQDVSGTLAGNWFAEGAGLVTAEMRESWSHSLAFVENNFDPAQRVISVGGVFMPPGYWKFDPNSEGQIDRDFDEVKPDGKIYCYTPEGMDGKILVELQDAESLRVEHQEGACSGVSGFQNPVRYIR